MRQWLTDRWLNRPIETTPNFKVTGSYEQFLALLYYRMLEHLQLVLNEDRKPIGLRQRFCGLEEVAKKLQWAARIPSAEWFDEDFTDYPWHLAQEEA